MAAPAIHEFVVESEYIRDPGEYGLPSFQELDALQEGPPRPRR